MLFGRESKLSSAFCSHEKTSEIPAQFQYKELRIVRPLAQSALYENANVPSRMKYSQRPSFASRLGNGRSTLFAVLKRDDTGVGADERGCLLSYARAAYPPTPQLKRE